MIFTDPPYNIPIQGNVSGKGTIRHSDFATACGEMDAAQFASFLRQVCSWLVQYSRDGSLHFLFMDWRHLAEIMMAGRGVYSNLASLCVWVKDNGGMGGLYRNQHELIFVFKRGSGPHRNNVRLGRYGRNRTNVWHHAGVNSFARATSEGNLLALHPTVKPVALTSDAILDCTTRGETVLDAFLGSGTTLIAAQRTGRRCYGPELDPRYVDTAIRRWQSFTGLNASYSPNGRTFNEIQVERMNGRGN